MMQQLEIGLLPDAALDAATAFMALYLEAARALLGGRQQNRECSAIGLAEQRARRFEI
jgi:hypothetical protein